MLGIRAHDGDRATGTLRLVGSVLWHAALRHRVIAAPPGLLDVARVGHGVHGHVGHVGLRHGSAAWAVLGAAAPCAGWRCPRASPPGSSRRRRSRYRPTARARSDTPVAWAVSTTVAHRLERRARWLAHLDEVLALGLSDEGLQLRGREGVDEARLRRDQEQDLGAREDRRARRPDAMVSTHPMLRDVRQ